MKQKNLIYDKFELINQFDKLSDFKKYISTLKYKTIKTNKGISYVNLPCAIDIEVSSFYDTKNEKVGLLYCFTLGINGHSYLGRTKDDLLNLISFIIDTFTLSKDKRLIFYVHNLSYEFQFFMKWFQWISVFALRNRTPVKAVTFDGIEFRCSYLLSGYSLEKIGEHLTTYKVNKMVGDLDYRKIRTPMTRLEDGEIKYVLNDGLIVMSYIMEQIEAHKNDITKIPLTKTGEVRKYCRNMCLYGGGGSHKNSVRSFLKYHYFIHNLTIQSINEYKQLKRAFSGGFTHANPLIVGKIQKDVSSYDFTSSYPAVMLSEKYPMTNGKLVSVKSKEQFYKYINAYCCLFDATFTNIESKIWFEHYISQSHCYTCINSKIDNGRLISADEISITLTEQDFKIIEKTYSWQHLKIKNFRIYKRDYLPKEFILAIINLYQKKTELKDVKGKEVEYLHSKELLNSCYGMCVTDICREEIEFSYKTNSWKETRSEKDYESDIKKYNDSKQRFLAYQWGIWVTAYARANLWNGILTIGNDYCYSDTDSLKIINNDKHKQYFIDYNNNLIEKLKKMLNHYNLSFDLISPKTINGETKIIGLWEYEYTCDFKTLGAKRYIVKRGEKYEITISGLNKQTTLNYLLRTNKNPFKYFKNEMYIPATYTIDDIIYIGTGKNTHTYIDEERKGIIKDYLGSYYEYQIDSCIHMEETDYTLSLSSEYIDLLFEIERIEFN
ncbi:MAG: hypothetical protein J6T10_27145 [Methanobrevibacter sp.]|nr:hypothetical protein [Methanobrevibacter sp.]